MLSSPKAVCILLDESQIFYFEPLERILRLVVCSVLRFMSQQIPLFQRFNIQNILIFEIYIFYLEHYY